MTAAAPRLGNVLILTPEGGGHIHTRALTKRSAKVVEFELIAAYKTFGIVETRRRIVALLDSEKIDVFFVTLYQDSHLLSPEFLAGLRDKVKIVLACYDDENAFEKHSRFYAASADAAITTDWFALPAYRALGVPAILCLNAVPEAMYPVTGEKRDIDVSFVGNCGKTDRRAYLAYLEQAGIKVERYGYGSKNGFVTNDEVAQIFRRSKINLSFSRLENPPPGKSTGHKGRPIEVAMSGAFCLTEDYPALPHVFELGKEIDVFNNTGSLLEKVRWYLAHDTERERIALAARARALRDYEERPSFDAVMRGLANAFAPPRRAADVRLTPAFRARRVGDVLVHVVSLLLHGRIGPAIEVLPEAFTDGSEALFAGLADAACREASILRRKLGA